MSFVFTKSNKQRLNPCLGCGLTTTLVSLIGQAGPADQAVATAVSYLFRSLGSVLCLSVGSTVFQATLRRRLSSTLEGADVDEVRASSAPSPARRLHRLTDLHQDRPSRARSIELHRRTRPAHPRSGTRSLRAVVAKNIRLLHLLVRNGLHVLGLGPREAVGLA